MVTYMVVGIKVKTGYVKFTKMLPLAIPNKNLIIFQVLVQVSNTSVSIKKKSSIPFYS